jgi:hypothetical protein
MNKGDISGKCAREGTNPASVCITINHISGVDVMQEMGARRLSPATSSTRFCSPSGAALPLAPSGGSMEDLQVNSSRSPAAEDRRQGNPQGRPLTLSLYSDSTGAASPERCPAPVVTFPLMYATGSGISGTVSGGYANTPSDTVRGHLAHLRRASASSVDATRLPSPAAAPPRASLDRWLSLPSLKLFAESIRF